MISDYRCFFCVARAFEKLLEKENITSEAKSYFTRDMAELYHRVWGTSSAPEFSRELYNILERYTQNHDPYKQAKRESNDLVMSMYDDLKRMINISQNPAQTALRLALAGNIIDFAAKSEFNLETAIKDALDSELSINHLEQLMEAIASANLILYLGDNAGEIVFDKLFIETINHHNLIYVVRGAPVINDATMEDAEYIGMSSITKVISNEYKAPSTIPYKSGKIFQGYFEEADLIISKGQGNLEGLLPLNDGRIFYLLMVKCFVIAEFLKVKKDSFVVYNPASG